jgi:hypothetical protein
MISLSNVLLVTSNALFVLALEPIIVLGAKNTLLGQSTTFILLIMNVYLLALQKLLKILLETKVCTLNVLLAIIHAWTVTRIILFCASHASLEHFISLKKFKIIRALLTALLSFSEITKTKNANPAILIVKRVFLALLITASLVFSLTSCSMTHKRAD